MVGLSRRFSNFSGCKATIGLHRSTPLDLNSNLNCRNPVFCALLAIDRSDGWICSCDDDLSFGIIGILGTCALSIVLFFLTRKKLRHEVRNDRSLVVKRTVAPFLGLAWPIVALLIHVQISNNP